MNIMQQLKDMVMKKTQQSRKNLEIISAKMEQENAWDYERKSKQILSKFNILNYNQKIGNLSGGQKKTFTSITSTRKC